MRNYEYNNTFSYEMTLNDRLKVMRQTYMLLALSLLPTAIGALVGVNMSFMFLLKSPILGSIVLMGAMYFLMFMVEKNKHNFNGVIWMLLFTFVMGILLGPLLQLTLRIPNGVNLILISALLTSIVFFVMSGIAYSVKTELTFVNNFLTVGAIVLFIAIIANIFLRLPILHLVICGAFVIFSSLMILWQVNQVIKGGERNYISATLSLYVSIYNLFTSLLQILLAFSGNDRR